MKFQYEAKAPDGRNMRGSFEAVDEKEILKFIRGNGWIPIDISRCGERTAFHGVSCARSKKITERSLWDIRRGVTLNDKKVFFRQFAAMTEAGIPLAVSLDVLIEQTQSGRFACVVSDLFRRVTSGSALSSAMAAHNAFFDMISISLIKSGEESGSLDANLAKIADILEAKHELRNKIISAAAYPAMVAIVAAVVLVIMFAVVVPQFEKAFVDLGVELPAYTKTVFKAGRLLHENWHVFAAMLAVSGASIPAMRRNKTLKDMSDTAALKIPILGGIMLKASLARGLGTASSMLRSGVPMLSALEMAGEAAGNKSVGKAFIAMRDGAALGRPVSLSARDTKIFPPMVVHMIAVGEETGRTGEMMGKAALWYESEINETVKRLGSVLEPFMVVCVGIAVGAIVISIFLPMVTAVNSFI